MSKLAIHGGEPVRTKPFPKWPRPTPELMDSVVGTVENENWGVGSEVISRFEENFAGFQDSKYCISTSSGTTALWVALKAANVKSGDEVIIPPYTFIATASAVLMANAVPVFVDIDPDTFNIDSSKIEEAITSKTKVIMPVHISGNPADMKNIIELAKKYDIKVIEDAAQAHGAEWNNTKVGSLGLGGIFSFQTSKNMSAGEGGAIVSNNKDFIDKCFSYHNCGRTSDGQFYDHQLLGGNFRLNAIAASMLIPQIKSILKDMDIRDKNRTILDSELSQIEGISINNSYSLTTRQSNHLYLLRYNSQIFNDVSREKFFSAMQAEGVYTYAGYKPIYREELFVNNSDEYPWLRDYDYNNLNLKNTEKIADHESVWIKQNHLLGDESDIKDIINAFEKVTNAIIKHPELF